MHPDHRAWESTRRVFSRARLGCPKKRSRVCAMQESSDDNRIYYNRIYYKRESRARRTSRRRDCCCTAAQIGARGGGAMSTPGMLMVLMEPAAGPEAALHDWFDLALVADHAPGAGVLVGGRPRCRAGGAQRTA